MRNMFFLVLFLIGCGSPVDVFEKCETDRDCRNGDRCNVYFGMCEPDPDLVPDAGMMMMMDGSIVADSGNDVLDSSVEDSSAPAPDADADTDTDAGMMMMDDGGNVPRRACLSFPESGIVTFGPISSEAESVPELSPLDAGVTIEAWVRPTKLQNGVIFQHYLFGRYTDPNTLRFTENGRFEFQQKDRFTITSPVASSLNEWHHVAVCVTRDRNNVYLFVDGLRVAGVNVLAGVIWTGTYGIGREIGEDVNHFMGHIDEVRMSAGCRYGASYMVPEHFDRDEDTALLFSFDEGAGWVVNEDANGNHGMIASPQWELDCR